MSQKTKQLEAQLESMRGVCDAALERERWLAVDVLQQSLLAKGYKLQAEDGEAAVHVLMALIEKRDAQAGARDQQSDEPGRFPEHEKLAKIDTRISQAIGNFLDCSGYVLAKYTTDMSGTLIQVSERTEQVLADYFGIDLDRIEQEKRQMLDQLRAAQAAGDAA